VRPAPPPDQLAAHRAHVRAVIESSAPATEAREGHRAPTSPAEEAELRQWYRAMYDEGLVGAGWPVEWGGDADHHPLHDVVVTEELIRARAPRPIDQVQLASHVLLHVGSGEQRRRYLPPIRSGEHIWCQLFSEPGAGSDLAGITTRASARPDGSFVVRGQKTWTTDGHWAQMGMLLARTDPSGERHRGITAFVVPMDLPGIEIRPIETIAGVPEFNEVYLDDVVVGPEAVVGDLHQGWAVAMGGLEVERFGVGGNVVLLELLLEDLVTLASRVGGDDPLINRRDVRVQIGRFTAEGHAAAAFVRDHIERSLLGREQEGDAAIAKVLYSESYNRISRYGVQLAEQAGVLPDGPAVVAAARLQDAWLWSRALTISGGSGEIMRNILAKRRLGLPSG